MTATTTAVRAVPDLYPGLTLLETPRDRTTALHRLALAHLDKHDGTGVWIDARGNAVTAYLDREDRPTPDLEIARAFTAYQHYELVRTLPGDLPRNLDLIVCPCLPSLYADPDIPDLLGEEYVESAVAILKAVADCVDVPVLVSASTDSPFLGHVEAAATKRIRFELTDLGFRFVAPDFETTVYWDEGFFQTTIPYWVELYGAVGESAPAVAIDEAGLLPESV